MKMPSSEMTSIVKNNKAVFLIKRLKAEGYNGTHKAYRPIGLKIMYTACTNNLYMS